jgi:hypothetical protein
MIVAQVLPNFQLDTEAGAALAVVVCSYIVGVAVDPGPGGWRGVLMSRKFWVAMVGFVFLFLSGFNIIPPTWVTQDMLVEIALMVGSLIAGFAIESKTKPLPVSEHDVKGRG